MFHKVKAVSALHDYCLSVQFAEGITKIYDVKPLFIKWAPFKVLKNSPELFSSVAVDVGGYGIIWNDDLDLSCDELWENGVDVKTPFDGLMAFSDATTLWELNESTLRKAIAYGKDGKVLTVLSPKDVCEIASGGLYFTVSEAISLYNKR